MQCAVRRPGGRAPAPPNEMEHLHPLDQEFEVCTVVPISVLRMLMMNITIIAPGGGGAGGSTGGGAASVHPLSLDHTRAAERKAGGRSACITGMVPDEMANRPTWLPPSPSPSLVSNSGGVLPRLGASRKAPKVSRLKIPKNWGKTAGACLQMIWCVVPLTPTSLLMGSSTTPLLIWISYRGKGFQIEQGIFFSVFCTKGAKFV